MILSIKNQEVSMLSQAKKLAAAGTKGREGVSAISKDGTKTPTRTSSHDCAENSSERFFVSNLITCDT